MNTVTLKTAKKDIVIKPCTLEKVIYDKQCIFRANFYPMRKILYMANIRFIRNKFNVWLPATFIFVSL